MAALLKTQDDMHARYMHDAEELARLRRERSEAPPVYRAENTTAGSSHDTEPTAPTPDQTPSASPVEESEEQEIRWPVGIP